MTFVERITQAVHIAANEAAADQEQYCSERMAKAAALAALKAMREPTESMEAAGDDTFEYDSSDLNGSYFLVADAYDCWQAMIDAAIDEAREATPA